LIARLLKDEEFKDLQFVAFKHQQWMGDLRKGYKEDDYGVPSCGFDVDENEVSMIHAKGVYTDDDFGLSVRPQVAEGLQKRWHAEAEKLKNKAAKMAKDSEELQAEGKVAEAEDLVKKATKIKQAGEKKEREAQEARGATEAAATYEVAAEKLKKEGQTAEAAELDRNAISRDKREQWARSVAEDGTRGLLPKKRLTVIGFDLGEGDNVSWTALSGRGLEFARSHMGISHAVVMTIGEGRAILDDLYRQKHVNFIHRYPRCNFIRLKTRRKGHGGKIEHSPITEPPKEEN
jgi:hypothetical protein